MSSSTERSRPLSPHLTIWRWGPHMAVSIMHRATGVGMSIAGVVLLVAWLVSLASGEAAYRAFADLLTVRSGGLNIAGYVLLIGLTLSFFQHMLSGVRHLVMDTGANYELRRNKMSAILTWVGSVTLTALYWAYLLTRN